MSDTKRNEIVFSVGIVDGEWGCGISDIVIGFSKEEMVELRSMICEAIWLTENFWYKGKQEKENEDRGDLSQNTVNK